MIATCVLRATSKMGEVGHRTETLRIGFQLIESVTDLVNDLAILKKVLKDPDGTPIYANSANRVYNCVEQ